MHAGRRCIHGLRDGQSVRDVRCAKRCAGTRVPPGGVQSVRSNHVRQGRVADSTPDARSRKRLQALALSSVSLITV